MKEILRTSVIFAVFMLLIPCIAKAVPPEEHPRAEENTDCNICYEKYSTDIEDYTLAFMRQERFLPSEKEALCALAAAARTRCAYLAEHDPQSLGQGIPSPSDDALREAAEETKGIIMTREGSPLLPLWHASSRCTENASDLYGSDIPYLKSVQGAEDCPVTEKSFTLRELSARIKNEYPDAEGLPVKINSTAPRGTVLSVTVCGAELSGQRAAELLTLKSPVFTVRETGDRVTFTVSGEGVPLGMSLSGADALARQGKSWREILDYYYNYNNNN